MMTSKDISLLELKVARGWVERVGDNSIFGTITERDAFRVVANAIATEIDNREADEELFNDDPETRDDSMADRLNIHVRGS